MRDPADGEPYDKWLMHWAGELNPWRLKRPKQDQNLPPNMPFVDPDEERTDGRGNVTYMPLLQGVPCFGSPLVSMRFRGLQFWNRRKYLYQSFRCVRCNARLACDKVVEERLNADPEIRRTADQYRKARKEALMAQPYVTTLAERRLSTHFKKALIDFGPFSNANDQAARVADENDRIARLRTDADRKRRSYQKRFRNGDVSDAVVREAEGERNARVVRAVAYKGWAGAPAWFKSIPDDGLQLTADVWLSGQLLRWRNLPHGPADIARDLTARGAHRAKSHDALRTRIAKVDLPRIEKLENVPLPDCGGPIWRKFTPGA